MPARDGWRFGDWALWGDKVFVEILIPLTGAEWRCQQDQPGILGGPEWRRFQEARRRWHETQAPVPPSGPAFPGEKMLRCQHRFAPRAHGGTPDQGEPGTVCLDCGYTLPHRTGRYRAN